MPSIAKNTFYLLVAYIYQKLIALFYFILLARYLGADNFGKYLFAISFMTLFSVLINFGLCQVLTREIARDRAKTITYFQNIFAFSLLAGVGALILAFGLINVSNYPAVTKSLVYLVGVSIFLDSVALVCYQVFRGHQDLKFESLGIIIHKTVMVGLGVFLIFLKVNVIWMMAPLVAGSLFYFLNALFFLKRKMGFWPIPRINKPIFKFLVKLAIPFFIALIFAKLYATIDTVLLSYLGGDKYVGWYGAAQKLSMAFLLLVAGSFGAALYPAFSHYFVRSRQALNKVFQRAVFYLMLITIPIVFGLIVLAKPIILLIYGPEYLPAVIVLVFFALAMPLMFLDYIISGLLNACEKQKANTVIRGIGVGVLIILNLILIPLYYHLGSAIACLASFLVLFSLECYLVPKLVQIEKKYLIKRLAGIFGASLLMAVVLLLLRNNLHLFLSVLAGILSYFSILYLFRVIKKEDILSIKRLISSGFKF